MADKISVDETKDFVIVDGVKVRLAKSVTAEEQEAQSVFKKMSNSWSSTSHVGSDFFNAYRRGRETELQRLSKMEEEAEEDEEQAAFQKHRLERMAANDARTAKNAEKRKKRKLIEDAKRQAKKAAKAAEAEKVDANEVVAKSDTAEAKEESESN